jgi:hypothetical protein
MTQLHERAVERVGDRRAALLGRAGGATPDELDMQPLAADLAQARECDT